MQQNCLIDHSSTTRLYGLPAFICKCEMQQSKFALRPCRIAMVAKALAGVVFHAGSACSWRAHRARVDLERTGPGCPPAQRRPGRRTR